MYAAVTVAAHPLYKKQCIRQRRSGALPVNQDNEIRCHDEATLARAMGL